MSVFLQKKSSLRAPIRTSFVSANDFTRAKARVVKKGGVGWRVDDQAEEERSGSGKEREAEVEKEELSTGVTGSLSCGDR